MAAVLEAAAGADSAWTDVNRRSPTTVKYVVTNKVQQQLAKRDRVAGGRGELGKGLGAVAEAERQTQRQEWRRGQGNCCYSSAHSYLWHFCIQPTSFRNVM